MLLLDPSWKKKITYSLSGQLRGQKADSSKQPQPTPGGRGTGDPASAGAARGTCVWATAVRCACETHSGLEAWKEKKTQNTLLVVFIKTTC